MLHEYATNPRREIGTKGFWSGFAKVRVKVVQIPLRE